MASYTTSLRLIQPATGEYPGSWGTQANNGLTALVDTSVAGTATITMVAADYTLSTANGATDEARAAVLSLGGTPGGSYNVIVPAVSKLYVVYNNTGAAQTVKTSAGTGVSVPNGAAAYLRCDGTNVVTAVNYFGSLTVGTVTGGTFVSPSLTGTPTAPTAVGGTSTTQIATTAFVATGFAPLASPAFTGTPTAPTAAAGTSTTQLATTAFVTATSFSSVLPGQTGNAGKYITTDGTNASWADVYPSLTGNAGNFLTNNGTTVSWSAVYPSQTGNSGNFLTTNGTTTSWASVYPSQTSNSGKFLTTNGTTTSWAFAGIAQVTTATTATTLTNTPTLLQITPTNYGVTVTLPDATTCSVGGPLHCIDNRGSYPVRVCNSTGVLKGFVFGGVTSYISLDNNSTAAGTWAISNSELVGASAQLFTSNMAQIIECISLDNNREILIGIGASNTNVYGVVYDKPTNTFGSVTIIRTASNIIVRACLSATNQILVVSCSVSSTAFEAVALSISGTTITVNTAATTTLSAGISNFPAGGLIPVGSSFVTSYTTSTPEAQIRALSISGTTVTIGSASVLNGTAGGLIAAATNHVIAASTAGTSIYTRPYLVSGSTLTAGTGTTFTSGTQTLNKLAALGTRWVMLYNDGGSNVTGGVVSLNATGNGTTTISTVSLLNSSGLSDAIIVGSNKVLVANNNSTNSVNLLTDTAGTASAGTAITLNGGASEKCFLYLDGTDAYLQDVSPSTGAASFFQKISCSGSSAVLTSTTQIQSSGTFIVPFTASNSVFRRSPNGIYANKFAATSSAMSSGSFTFMQLINSNILNVVPNTKWPSGWFSPACSGVVASEVWVLSLSSSFIGKLECAV